MKELARNKAVEIVFRYYEKNDLLYESSFIKAKECALIAVDYLIAEQEMWQNGEPNPVLFWQEVKKEIEQL